MDIRHGVMESEQLLELLEDWEFIDIEEAKTEDNKMVPTTNKFGSRAFGSRQFDFGSRVYNGNLVLPFKLGPYVPIEALSSNWQRHLNQGGSSRNIYHDLVNKIARGNYGRTKRDLMRDRYETFIDELLVGVNMDTSFNPIIPFSGSESGADGVNELIRYYGREPIKTLNSAIALVEQKTLEFVTTYGFITIQKTHPNFRGLEAQADSFSRIARNDPSSRYYFPFGNWMMSGIGTIYDEQGMLQGCFFVPYDVYTYQYASINTGRERRQAYYKPLDFYTDQNCFYVMSEKAKKTIDPIEAVEDFVSKKRASNSGDIPLYFVEDLLEFITGEPFNDKILTFQDL